RPAAFAGAARLPLAARRPQGPEVDRVNARSALLTAVLLLAPLAASAADARRPLLDFARQREQSREHGDHTIASRADPKEAQHAVDQGHVPREAECARSLGAQRYANLYTSLAGTRASMGDLSGAAAAYRSAHACRPRDPNILAALGGVLFDARR